MSFLDDERQEMAERLRQHGAPERDTERPSEQKAKIAAANRYNSTKDHHGQTERNAFWKGWDEHREYALRPDHVTTGLDDKGRPTQMVVAVSDDHPFQGHPAFSPTASFGEDPRWLAEREELLDLIERLSGVEVKTTGRQLLEGILAAQDILRRYGREP